MNKFWVAISICFFISGASYQAQAHGDAMWIAQGGYKDVNMAPCCGTQDCKIAKEGEVLQELDGYHIVDTGQFFRLGDPGVHASIDDHIWLCRYMNNPYERERGGPSRVGQVRCLFVQPMGS